MFGVKIITPFGLQDPPRPSGASQSTCTGPPASATFFSLPAEKQPMSLQSGDQNGNVGRSPSATSCNVPVASSRTHNLESELPPVKKASLEPSGESVGAPN